MHHILELQGEKSGRRIGLAALFLGGCLSRFQGASHARILTIKWLTKAPAARCAPVCMCMPGAKLDAEVLKARALLQRRNRNSRNSPALFGAAIPAWESRFVVELR